MKIMNMRKGSWGKLTAFFDVATDEGFIIKGFKLFNGINGLFVGMPSEKRQDENGEDKYFDTVWLTENVRESLREKLNTMASEEFNKDNPGNSFPASENINTADSNVVNDTPPSISSDDTKTGETVEEQPFSKDDLPF